MTRQVFEAKYQNACAALRKPLSDGGGVGLTAAFRDCTASDIAEVVSNLTHEEALAVFSWLGDAQAVAMLTEVPEEMAAYVVKNAPAGRIARLTGEEMDPKLHI